MVVAELATSSRIVAHSICGRHIARRAQLHEHKMVKVAKVANVLPMAMVTRELVVVSNVSIRRTPLMSVGTLTMVTTISL
jgi:hypothetical protein